MQLLEKYINQNIDYLYANRARIKEDESEDQSIQTRKIIMAQELEAIPWEELSVKQKWTIDRDKTRYAQELLKEAEGLVLDRR